MYPQHGGWPAERNHDDPSGRTGPPGPRPPEFRPPDPFPMDAAAEPSATGGSTNPWPHSSVPADHALGGPAAPPYGGVHQGGHADGSVVPERYDPVPERYDPPFQEAPPPARSSPGGAPEGFVSSPSWNDEGGFGSAPDAGQGPVYRQETGPTGYEYGYDSGGAGFPHSGAPVSPHASSLPTTQISHLPPAPARSAEPSGLPGIFEELAVPAEPERSYGHPPAGGTRLTLGDLLTGGGALLVFFCSFLPFVSYDGEGLLASASRQGAGTWWTAWAAQTFMAPLTWCVVAAALGALLLTGLRVRLRREPTVLTFTSVQLQVVLGVFQVVVLLGYAWSSKTLFFGSDLDEALRADVAGGDTEAGLSFSAGGYLMVLFAVTSLVGSVLTLRGTGPTLLPRSPKRFAPAPPPSYPASANQYQGTVYGRPAEPTQATSMFPPVAPSTPYGSGPYGHGPAGAGPAPGAPPSGAVYGSPQADPAPAGTTYGGTTYGQSRADTGTVYGQSSPDPRYGQRF